MSAIFFFCEQLSSVPNTIVTLGGRGISKVPSSRSPYSEICSWRKENNPSAAPGVSAGVPPAIGQLRTSAPPVHCKKERLVARPCFLSPPLSASSLFSFISRFPSIQSHESLQTWPRHYADRQMLCSNFTSTRPWIEACSRIDFNCGSLPAKYVWGTLLETNEADTLI
jgi:hypothetical protein